MAGVKEKVKKNARDFLPWAGYFIDGALDPEIFATLPGWRQRESRYIRDRVRSGLPVSMDEALSFQTGNKLTPTQIGIPLMLTLDALSRRPIVAADGLLLHELRDSIRYEWVIEKLTTEGRELVRIPPTHGILSYLWRLALVHKGVLREFPIQGFWELEEGIYLETGRMPGSMLSDEAQPFLLWLDALVGRVVAAVG